VSSSENSTHVDVLIVGAGLSGIAAGHHLQASCPGKTYAILEARDTIGGTWDLFRYPGIRSDSDMFTLGYKFRPWADAKAIAGGPEILQYVRETARDEGIDRHIRFGHKVLGASWSTADAQWTVDVERADGGETLRFTCGFLFSCTGYYRYDQGFTPQLPGMERFGGQLVHPQHWPEDLDYAGKKVVVIGSGATAVTLVPAMASEAEHVTMLQRSPSYVMAMPARDPIADVLHRRLPGRLSHPLVRWKNVLFSLGTYQLSRRAPRLTKRFIRRSNARQLPEGYDVGTHFAPTYDPWDQRMCLVPDGDLFRAIRRGSAAVVTDRIETFTETGIQLQGGEHLEADIVVTATGLNLQAIGGMQLVVDGKPVELGDTLTYKGTMVSGVPNYAIAIGYTNASWTLKCDLICEYVCRLLNHMDARGHRSATPLPRAGAAAETKPFLDLTAGYVQRSLDKFPRQGAQAPWQIHQSYFSDIRMLRHGGLEDGMAFDAAAPAPRATAAAAAAPRAEELVAA
jgi:cation diffusion facilitator CzcD-associated flavoprotein CzcO